MSYPEKVAYVQDIAIRTFPGITSVTGIVPIEGYFWQLANGADTNFLAPVAGHIYYLEQISLIEVLAIAGNPRLRGYDIGAVVLALYTMNLSATDWYKAQNLWVSRLAHQLNGATAGRYSLLYNGFDLTYT